MDWLMMISSLRAQDGGPSRAVLGLATALAKDNHKVTILTYGFPGEVDDPTLHEAEMAGVVIERVSVRRVTTFRFSLRYLVRACWLARKADFVTLHGFYQFTTVAAYLASRAGRIPLAVMPHGVFEPYQEARGSRFKPLFRRVVGNGVLHAARYFAVASEQEREGIVTSTHVDPDRIHVVGLGTALSPIAPAPARYEQRTVLFLSRIAPKKRLDLLLEAQRVETERGRPFNLMICGDGNPPLVAELKALNTSEDVRWLGHLDGEARALVEAQCSLFCLPSDNENFGQAVTEAMAAGLPVITTDQVGAAAHVQAAGSGWVIKPPDSGELATVIRDALSDPSRLESMACRGITYVTDELSWSRVATNWTSAYMATVGSFKRRSAR